MEPSSFLPAAYYIKYEKREQNCRAERLRKYRAPSKPFDLEESAMKKATSCIWLITLTALALLSLGGCAQEKEENTEENDPQAREAILQCCELIFGSAEETGNYHIRVTDERDGGRVDEYDCPRGADEQGYGNSPVYALS